MTSLLERHRRRVVDVAIALVAFVLTRALLLAGGVDAGGEHEPRDVDVLGVLLAALSTLPLAARRWSPFAVYVFVTLANTALTVADYGTGPPFGPTIALYFLAAAAPAERPAGRVLVPAIVALFAVHFVAFALTQDVFPTLQLLLGTTLWAAVWFAGDRGRLRRERVAELEERTARLEREAERERRLAAAEERTRIARDLHDSAGHAINVILVQAGAARLLSERDPERSRAALETIETVARETLTEIDHLVRALRDDGRNPDAVEPPTGLAALDSLAERHRATGLDVAVLVDGPSRPLAPAVDQAAYRIVQESLTNAMLHGDRKADVSLSYGDEALEIAVTNPVSEVGRASGSGGGHGLVGMRERAHLVGGTLDTARDDGVFRVRARLPYAQTAAR